MWMWFKDVFVMIRFVVNDNLLWYRTTRKFTLSLWKSRKTLLQSAVRPTGSIYSLNIYLLMHTHSVRFIRTRRLHHPYRCCKRYGWIHVDPTTFWKSLFISNFLCSIDRSAVENRFGRIYFVNYAWNTGESGHCLGTPMKEADLIDSLGVWRWYFGQR